jgi:hypothetical protein
MIYWHLGPEVMSGLQKGLHFILVGLTIASTKGSFYFFIKGNNMQTISMKSSMWPGSLPFPTHLPFPGIYLSCQVFVM